MPNKHGYDSRCYDLARVFLEDIKGIDHAKGCDDLAQLIQQTIEDWIEMEYGERLGLPESGTRP